MLQIKLNLKRTYEKIGYSNHRYLFNIIFRHVESLINRLKLHEIKLNYNFDLFAWSDYLFVGEITQNIFCVYLMVPRRLKHVTGKEKGCWESSLTEQNYKF